MSRDTVQHTYRAVTGRAADPEPNYAEAVAEELRSHDDVLDELDLAPVFTPEDMDFSNYRWGRGDYRSQRDMDLYESGHSAKDFF